MRNDSSKFYDDFADKYDTMVSDESYRQDLPFFKSIFEKNHVRSVLDCSCGTGKHVLLLSKADVNTVDYRIISAESLSKMTTEADSRIQESTETGRVNNTLLGKE